MTLSPWLLCSPPPLHQGFQVSSSGEGVPKLTNVIVRSCVKQNLRIVLCFFFFFFFALRKRRFFYMVWLTI